MDYAMNELEQEVLNATRELAQKKLKPLRAEMDAKEEFSHECWKNTANRVCSACGCRKNTAA